MDMGPPLQSSIEASTSVRRSPSIVLNALWVSGDKAARLVGTLALGTLMAREFGPTEFGVFNYVTAYVAVLASFASLGMQTIVVREIVSARATTRSLATAFLLHLSAGAALAVIGVLIAVLMIGWDRGAQITWGICVLALSIPLKASDVVRYWFEAMVDARKIVLVEFRVWILFLAAKAIALLTGFGLKAIFTLVFAEVLVTFLVFSLLCKQHIVGKTDLRPARDSARALLKESWPLMISAASIMLYMRLDQLMIGHYQGQAAVGIYSAATRIGEAWYFLPLALVSSAFPALIRVRLHDTQRYQSNLRIIATAICLLAYAVAIVTTVLADYIVVGLYGAPYAASADVLKIYVWGGAFVGVSTLAGRWLVAEGLTYFAAVRSVIGAVVNIALNALLIPRLGVLGAAIATVISFAVANVLSFGISTRSRPLFWLLLRSLALLDLPLLLRAISNKIMTRAV